jgi:hypothetical protein
MRLPDRLKHGDPEQWFEYNASDKNRWLMGDLETENFPRASLHSSSCRRIKQIVKLTNVIES